jgi:hypothetical protein
LTLSKSGAMTRKSCRQASTPPAAAPNPARWTLRR